MLTQFNSFVDEYPVSCTSFVEQVDNSNICFCPFCQKLCGHSFICLFPGPLF